MIAFIFRFILILSVKIEDIDIKRIDELTSKVEELKMKHITRYNDIAEATEEIRKKFPALCSSCMNYEDLCCLKANFEVYLACRKKFIAHIMFLAESSQENRREAISFFIDTMRHFNIFLDFLINLIEEDKTECLTLEIIENELVNDTTNDQRDVFDESIRFIIDKMRFNNIAESICDSLADLWSLKNIFLFDFCFDTVEKKQLSINIIASNKLSNLFYLRIMQLHYNCQIVDD